MHGEEALAPFQDPDLVGSRLHDSELPLFEVGDGADVDAHPAFSSTAAFFTSCSRFHP